MNKRSLWYVFVLLIMSGFLLWGTITPKSAPFWGDNPLEEAVEPVEELASIVTQGSCGEVEMTMPEPLRAIYMSSWVAGTPRIRNKLIKQIENTDLNAVVIDIKDVTGHVMMPFDPGDMMMPPGTVKKNRVKDFPEFLEELCEKGIYPIARVVVFKDPLYAQQAPDQAILYESGNLWWGDGSNWVSPASEQYWEYITELSKQAYQLGFREINFDYIRYPSIGNLSAARYSGQGERTRREVMQDLLKYLDVNLRQRGVPISADIFGMSLSASDDVGIGQYFEDFLPYMDAVAPMVYPSHYYPGFAGVESPANHPYRVISVSVGDGIERLEAAGYEKAGLMRPWLQDFTYQGVYYGSHEVQQQIKALEDLGIHSWILWDPQNTYHYK